MSNCSCGASDGLGGLGDSTPLAIFDFLKAGKLPAAPVHLQI